METKELTNKETGEVLKTKEDGKTLVEHRLEPGDEFIPLFSSVKEEKHDAVVKGKKTVITRYVIKARVRDKDKKVCEYDGSDEIFVTLTESQANTLKKKIDAGILLTQTLFCAYTYENEHGEQVGVGERKDRLPPKTFEEFDSPADDG